MEFNIKFSCTPLSYVASKSIPSTYTIEWIYRCKFFQCCKIVLQTFRPWLDCSHEKIVKHHRWWPVISVLIFPIILLFFTPQFLFYVFFAHLKNFLLFLRSQNCPVNYPKLLNIFSSKMMQVLLLKENARIWKEKGRNFYFRSNKSPSQYKLHIGYSHENIFDDGKRDAYMCQ